MKRQLAYVVVACLAAAGLTACSDSGNAAESDSSTAQAFSIATPPPTMALLPFYVADEEGFFEKEGLKASFVTVASGSAMLSGFTAGQLDVIPNTIANAAKVRQGGQDVEVISGHSVGYNYVIYTRDGLSLPANGTFKEKMLALQGLNIGAQGGADGTTVPFVKAVMHMAGADPSTLKFANVGFGGPQVAALRSGEVDAVIADEGTVATLGQLGTGTPFFSLLTGPPQEYQNLLISGVLATNAFLSQHPDFAKSYVAAFNNAIEWMKDPNNLKELHRVATEVQGMPDSASLNDSLAGYGPLLTAYVDQAQLEKSLEFLYSSGQLPPEPHVTVNDLFVNTMIK